MSKGGSTPSSTTVENNQPPPAFTAAYENIVNQASQVAATPYQNYSGQIVAPLSAQQQQGITGISALQGTQTPYLNAAQGEFNSATTPLWSNTQQLTANDINQFQSPYTADVTAATQAQFSNLNQQQQQQLTGSAVQQGAFGGDRAAVAAGVLGGQQTAQEAPVLAGIQQQGYNTALQTAEEQQTTQLGANEANAWLASQAGFGESSLGAEEQNLGLQGAQAEIGAGGITQQQQQSELNVPYEQFLAQQAYPFQTTGWEAGIDEGIGSEAGGTGASQTTESGNNPSEFSQIAGDALGIGALAMMLKRGGGIPEHLRRDIIDHVIERAARGGIIQRRDSGGIIPGGIDLTVNGTDIPTNMSWVPAASATAHGPGPPKPPSSMPKSSQGNSVGSELSELSSIKNLTGAGKSGGTSNGSSFLGGASGPLGAGNGILPGDNTFMPGTFGGIDASASGDLTQAAFDPSMDMLAMDAYRRGGIIRRDDGGEIDSGFETGNEGGPGPPPPPAAGVVPHPADETTPRPVDFKAYQAPGTWDSGGAGPMALLAASAGILGSRSRHGSVALGEGIQAGLKTYLGEKGQERTLEQQSGEKKATLDQEAQKLSDDAEFHRSQLKNEGERTDIARQQATQTGAYQTGELAARNREIGQTGAYQQGELSDRQRQLDIQEQQGRYTYMNGTRLNPDTNQPESGMWKIEGKSGSREFIPDTSVSRPTGAGGAQSASQWKYNTWLAVHPGDNGGALDFVAGHKQMGPQDFVKFGLQQAQKELGSGAQPDAIDARAGVIADSLKSGKAPPPPPPEAPGRGFWDTMFGGSAEAPAAATPTPGTPAAPAAAAPAQRPAAQSPAAGPVLPPAALGALKEGVNTTFKNGQTWTLTNGKPQQVQ